LRRYAKSGWVADLIPDEVIRNFSWPNSSSCTRTLGPTQPLTEISTRNLPVGKGRLARKANNLTAICELIIWKIWEPWYFTTLWTSTTCYRDSSSFNCVWGCTSRELTKYADVSSINI
jgi:hypothetical protein